MAKIALPAMRNPLIVPDGYKTGHMRQYAPGTEFVYSVLSGRSAKVFPRFVWNGLSYIQQQYLSTPLEPWMGEEFLEIRKMMLRVKENPPEVVTKIRDLCSIGHYPIEIRALPEGTVVPSKNAVATAVNTVPGFGWCVGYLETLLSKVHSPCTVGAMSLAYRDFIESEFAISVDDDQFGLIDYMVNDFGARSDVSQESESITGLAHSIVFKGSDTVSVIPFALQYYGGVESIINGEGIIHTIDATEHSVMCSYGEDDEIGAIKRMLELHPNVPVSIVSDTYDIYRVLTEYVDILFDDIMSRPDGAPVIFRPDSGIPNDVLCGNNLSSDERVQKGCIRLLDDKFGSTTNTKGFQVLSPKVGLIYGDAMYLDRYKEGVRRMREELMFAASTLPIGVGGILRSGTRDTIGFTMKATHVTRFGKPIDIWKHPVTDPHKNSYKGYVGVFRGVDGEIHTRDQLSSMDEPGSLLVPVHRNGEVLVKPSLNGMRRLVLARKR